ncbi:MAG: hypothetical protein PHU71_03795 [Candidatus Gracilibacteria bacterium]|nr:hypothetical protein [Candidatus Gracilibacteria bacterium]
MPEKTIVARYQVSSEHLEPKAKAPKEESVDVLERRLEIYQALLNSDNPSGMWYELGQECNNLINREVWPDDSPEMEKLSSDEKIRLDDLLEVLCEQTTVPSKDLLKQQITEVTELMETARKKLRELTSSAE